jgi:hypothetical protein
VHTQGTGAPSRLALAFALSLSALALTATPALAAAPETPETLPPTELKATTATLHGLLNPLKEGGLFELATYEFIYRQSPTACKGAGEVKTTEGLSLGGGKEEVSQAIETLTANTQYTVCVVAHNEAKTEEAVSLPVTFKTALPPETPETKPATEVTATSWNLHGVLNPNHEGEAGTYEFRYQPSESECEGERTSGAGGGALGHEKEMVSISVSELLPATTYTFCLRAENKAGETAIGSPQTFTTPTAAPVISEEQASDVGATTVTLTAEVDPGGLSTGYHVEYVTETQFQKGEYADATDVPVADTTLPAATGPLGVSEQLSGLAAGTPYHFRFRATNILASTPGPDATFLTARATEASSASLPDNRVYELVSGEHAEVYASNSPSQDEAGAAGQIFTPYPFRASISGDAAVYAGDPPASAGNGSQGPGEGNEFLARRTSKGWETTDLTPTGAKEGAAYEAFSSDLSVGILADRTVPPLVAEPSGPASCNIQLYSSTSSDQSLHALFTTTQTPGDCGVPFFVGFDEHETNLLFETEAALTQNAAQAPGEGHDNIYDSVAGSVRLVNVLPGGESDPNATAGGLPAGQNRPDFSNAISSDGSRVFWTDLDKTGSYAGDIFVTEDGKPSVQMSSAAAQFWTATPDGRYVFYTEEEKLWRAELSAAGHVDARVELVGSGANLKGVIGTSDDGSYVYFVAGGVLASNENSSGVKAVPGDCKEAIPGEEGTEPKEEAEGHLGSRGCNLYLLHIGTAVKFIATLAPKDNNAPAEGGANSQFGDWQPDLGSRTAEVTPDGHNIVFETRQRLTGYNNAVAGTEPAIEVFVYDTNSERIACASCNPSGAAPNGPTGAALSATTSSIYTRRWISEDGSRVFFDTDEALVSQDTNHVRDVYEWEREAPGAPGCPQTTQARPSGGCIYLLSGGVSPAASYFADASATGGNVFFTTRARLVPHDTGEEVHLYDAREGGGFPETSEACEGAGCQGVPPAPPTFATPPSVTFSGVGNFSPLPVVGTRAKPLTRKQKLEKALKMCRSKHNRMQRAACERQARKLYGTKAKSRKRSKKGKN